MIFNCLIYIFVMGCSHSVREEKPQYRKKRPQPKEPVLIPIESKPPTLANKIVVKSITNSTRESRNVSPIQSHPSQNEPPPTKPRKKINPYEMGQKKSYGYPGVCQVSSKKIVNEESEN